MSETDGSVGDAMGAYELMGGDGKTLEHGKWMTRKLLASSGTLAPAEPDLICAHRVCVQTHVNPISRRGSCRCASSKGWRVLWE
jgi:hypothetical protein